VFPFPSHFGKTSGSERNAVGEHLVAFRSRYVFTVFPMSQSLQLMPKAERRVDARIEQRAELPAFFPVQHAGRG
jgi:hypothetical protein